VSAVVFDCDGVLVDSEPISVAAWRTVLGGFGYAPTEEDFTANLGKASADTYSYFAARVTLPARDVVVAAVDAERHQGYDDGLVAFDDAVAAVQTLAMHGVAMAVASSSARHTLDHKLEVSGLARYFDAVVSADEVERGKPHPDLYLAAAARLGVDPRRCLAVEDSVTGADSAVAAGMRVVVVDRGWGAVGGRYAATSHLDAELLLMWLPG